MADKFDIERKIINAFKLFQGLRSPSEDRAILEKMLEICKEDAISFLSENMTDKDVNKFKAVVKKDGIESAFGLAIGSIPMGRFRLEERLNYAINMHLAKALSQK